MIRGSHSPGRPKVEYTPCSQPPQHSTFHFCNPSASSLSHHVKVLGLLLLPVLWLNNCVIFSLPSNATTLAILAAFADLGCGIFPLILRFKLGTSGNGSYLAAPDAPPEALGCRCSELSEPAMLISISLSPPVGLRSTTSVDGVSTITSSLDVGASLNITGTEVLVGEAIRGRRSAANRVSCDSVRGSSVGN